MNQKLYKSFVLLLFLFNKSFTLVDFEFREIGRKLSQNCLKNISEEIIFCTEDFSSAVSQIKSDQNPIQIECCSLWKWKQCLINRISPSTHQKQLDCNESTDLPFIYSFPEQNSVANLFISSYCRDYSNGSDSCLPFATWKIILISISSSIIIFLFIYCFIDCIRYKMIHKKRKTFNQIKKTEIVSRL